MPAWFTSTIAPSKALVTLPAFCPVRHGWYNLIGVCVALYSLLIHKLVRKHLMSSWAQINPRCVVPGFCWLSCCSISCRTGVLQSLFLLAKAKRWYWLGKICECWIKFWWLLFPLQGLRFSLFFYTAFKMNLFFVSKVPPLLFNPADGEFYSKIYSSLSGIEKVHNNK